MGSFDLQPYQNFPPIFDLQNQNKFPIFFTGRKLHPPGIGIKATDYNQIFYSTSYFPGQQYFMTYTEFMLQYENTTK